ncbi:MAG: LytTR family transcriptional regulator DNA-binding domain-containing protein [Lachnospiraceae bacterium]|nr:LytTR family transcriptional regulator DNA-binding domain-containing protein [Lachnospiraceae bacterium]
MKISIEEIGREQEEEILIRCYELNDQILQIMSRLKSREDIVMGYQGSAIHRIALRNVYYFEAVDNKVFIYCHEQVYESRQRLYEIEEMYGGGYFLRTSKAIVMNIKKIKYVSPALNGRFEACLDNGEKQIISRQYVNALKKKLMI